LLSDDEKAIQKCTRKKTKDLHIHSRSEYGNRQFISTRKGYDMKTKLMTGLILLTFLLAACGGTPTPAASQPTAEPALTVAPTSAAASPATEAPSTGSVSFAKDVGPILSNSCVDCHGGNQTKAGLDLKTYDGVMAGSFNGAVIVPGKTADSLLLQLIADGKMPKRGPKLTAEQIQVINDWIAAGALNN
jgi:hypothetical protein